MGDGDKGLELTEVRDIIQEALEDEPEIFSVTLDGDDLVAETVADDSRSFKITITDL